MSTNDLSIRSLAESDRPREKLRAKGHSVLTDSELMAILLGSGLQNKSAITLAREMLSAAGNLRDLGRWNIDEFCAVKGIGLAKATCLMAAFELGRRSALVKEDKPPQIKSSDDAYQFLKPILSDLHHEEFWVLYLSNSNRVLKSEKLSQGGMTGTVADLRIMFRTALTVRATGVILAHNHPSGKLTPSDADRKLTYKAVDAGKIMDVGVVDHLIVTANDYISFADEGWI